MSNSSHYTLVSVSFTLCKLYFSIKQKPNNKGCIQHKQEYLGPFQAGTLKSMYKFRFQAQWKVLGWFSSVEWHDFIYSLKSMLLLLKNVSEEDVWKISRLARVYCNSSGKGWWGHKMGSTLRLMWREWLVFSM